ncbi:MAG: MBL fold metallo-hydrolase [Sandaracinaceae bacterium]|jgi:phosphoribosyl 1,2-cyclic phosphodiesterase|nr:MBL fold metallo-hydrolase [Sandaracinaceae bacterium]
MKIRFWGVRGSIASPGPHTARVGGNTSSVEVECGSAHFLLDAGTGLRSLGEDLLARNVDPNLTLLLSHYHWDHIQGLPFFAPAYLPQTKITIIGGANGLMSVRQALQQQMSAPVFPVRLDELRAEIQTREVQSGQSFDVGDARVRVLRLNHPGGVFAYRIDCEGSSVVYATDTEHYACVDPALRALCDGADVLIYDSQYTPEEYAGKVGPSKVGWGHSTYVAGADLAKAAGVGQYVMFHHDPKRTDKEVLELQRITRMLFPPTIAAREGLVLELQRRKRGTKAA